MRALAPQDFLSPLLPICIYDEEERPCPRARPVVPVQKSRGAPARGAMVLALTDNRSHRKVTALDREGQHASAGWW